MSLAAEVVSHELICGPDGLAAIHLLKLRVPALARAARPGQFIMLKVSAGLQPLLARPFSLHDVEEQDILILYQVVGTGTRILSQVKPGQELSLWGPLGRGFEHKAGRTVLVAGGMGIAPLAYAAKGLSQAGGAVRLLAGFSRGRQAEAVERHLSARLAGSKVELCLATEDGGRGEKGLVTALLPPALADCSSVLACGPVPMLKEVARICGQAGRECQVSMEAPMACGLGACQGCAVPASGGGYLHACQEGPVFSARQVDWSRL